MRNSKKYISAILRYLFFSLFVAYYSSITMFYHLHMVNGHIIAHSHPFKADHKDKGPFQSHPHSSSAYNLIHHLNKTNWEEAQEVGQIPKPIFVFFAYNVNCISPDFNPNKHFHAQLRAPPSV